MDLSQTQVGYEHASELKIEEIHSWPVKTKFVGVLIGGGEAKSGMFWTNLRRWGRRIGNFMFHVKFKFNYLSNER